MLSCRASSYGSLKVVLSVPTRPMCSVTAAIAARIASVFGSPEDVEVVDPPAVLAQPQALGEEQVVEQAPLGVAGEVLERREVDLAARRGIGPHRGVVTPGKCAARWI